jgi:hypothetical protein
MRRPAGIVALGLALAGTGCGVDDDRDQVRASASQFYAALERHDGATACDHLSPPAAEALEKVEDRRCDRAILGLDLGQGPVRDVAVYETDAVVTLPGGERAYLDRRAGGWKVSAAGCRLLPAGPADCELED